MQPTCCTAHTLGFRMSFIARHACLDPGAPCVASSFPCFAPVCLRTHLRLLPPLSLPPCPPSLALPCLSTHTHLCHLPLLKPPAARQPARQPTQPGRKHAKARQLLRLSWLRRGRSFGPRQPQHIKLLACSSKGSCTRPPRCADMKSVKSVSSKRLSRSLIRLFGSVSRVGHFPKGRQVEAGRLLGSAVLRSTQAAAGGCMAVVWRLHHALLCVFPHNLAGQQHQHATSLPT